MESELHMVVLVSSTEVALDLGPKSWRKCTFNPYIFHFFHFGPYILFLPLLVPKPINVSHFSLFRQPTSGKG